MTDDEFEQIRQSIADDLRRSTEEQLRRLADRQQRAWAQDPPPTRFYYYDPAYPTQPPLVCHQLDDGTFVITDLPTTPEERP